MQKAVHTENNIRLCFTFFRKNSMNIPLCIQRCPHIHIFCVQKRRCVIERKQNITLLVKFCR